MTHQRTLTAAHWGVYEVEYDDNGKADAPPSFLQGSRSLADRPAHAVRRGDAAARAPSGGAQELAGERPRRGSRKARPGAVRRGRSGTRRSISSPRSSSGSRTRTRNRAIFGGSYGWSSAGRFHHAQSQVHRFLNSIGGYVRHQDSYSLGAARVLMPHIVAPMDELMSHAHAVGRAWPSTASSSSPSAACRTRTPDQRRRRHAASRQGRALRHARQGVRFVNVTPTRRRSRHRRRRRVAGDPAQHRHRPDPGALPHAAWRRTCTTATSSTATRVGFDKFAPYARRGKDAAWAEKITGIPAARIAALAREHGGDRAPWSASTGRCSAAITASSRSGRWSRSPACWARSACRAAASASATARST